MSIAAFVTEGIGPGGSIKYLLTGGFDLGAPAQVFRGVHIVKESLTSPSIAAETLSIPTITSESLSSPTITNETLE